MPTFDSAEKTSSTLSFLMEAFAEVLASIGAEEVASTLPWQAPGSSGATTAGTQGFPDEIAEQCVQAYSIAFQLLNTAEENAVAQSRRATEAAGRGVEDPGSWDQMLSRLVDTGLGGEQIAATLSRLRVEPVFTAHPTEAKRQTVLEHHRRLYRRLVELENSMWSASEKAGLVRELKAELERLWRTGEIYLEKPSLEDERRGVMHYLVHVFPVVLPWFTAHLEAAWERAGLDSSLLTPDRLPQISFGDWVGGDRDGHPGVTAQVTQETLDAFRSAALSLLDNQLEALAVRLSLSETRRPAPPSLLDRIAALESRLGKRARRARPNVGEPWRRFVNLLRLALPRDEESGVFAVSADLVDQLEGLRNDLLLFGADRLVATDVDPLLQTVRTFGFHLAVLDVRQNSAFHDRALTHLLERAGVPDASAYPTWGLDRRRELLETELATRRPFAPPGAVEQPEARAVMNVYRRLAAHREQHGDLGIGSLIVSMTRSTEDLLTVYVLARDGGLLLENEDGRWCPFEVVPLFETIDDLERAPDILDAFLAHPVTRASQQRRQRDHDLAEPIQQVMIGYSDSCKDGGIVRSFWSLYKAQKRLAEVGRRHGVRVRFFHGRGGTIGRGAGPTHRFLKALPADAVRGDLRMTEQGESIAQKYANRVTAAHHLELLAAGTLYATLSNSTQEADPPELLHAMDSLARDSQTAYRDLLEADGFVAFFETATPLDVLEASRIGSRPARRTGRRTLGDLRAIPWVFAWNQSRFGLPGWFGLGSALLALRDVDPSRFEALRIAKSEASRWNPWHYLISNAATALMTSNREVMELYAGLVEEADLRDRILARILDEHTKTAEALAAIYGAPLSSARPTIRQGLAVRHQALLPLHEHQVALLRDWRGLRAAGDTQGAEALLLQLLLTVNAIASGLGATG